MIVKVCGFTNPKDVEIACDLGVDMVGAVMVPGSKRYLSVERARDVLGAVSDDVDKVAVIRPRGLDDLKRCEDQLEPDYLQIHLTSQPDELAKLRGGLSSGLILVAPVPQEAMDRQAVIENALRTAEVCDILLLDTKGSADGGTGLTHDWTISREIKKMVKTPVFLAGGLDPSNVAGAIGFVRPDGVDVATGVESSDGRKDPKLMRDFVRAARGK